MARTATRRSSPSLSTIFPPDAHLRRLPAAVATPDRPRLLPRPERRGGHAGAGTAARGVPALGGRLHLLGAGDGRRAPDARLADAPGPLRRPLLRSLRGRRRPLVLRR